MNSARWAGAGVLLAAEVAGLAFGSVFSLLSVVAPISAVVVAVGLADQLAEGRPGAAVWRPAVASLLGALAGAAALAYLPPAPGMRPVLDGLRNGWLRTLESTFPARPDPELMAFVPLLVLVAAVIGVEWLRRGLPAPVTLLPSAAVLALSQLYAAATGWSAVALACAYGLALATVLGSGRRLVRRARSVLVVALPLVLVASGTAWALAQADVLHRSPYSVHDAYQIVPVPDGVENPLAQLGGRLTRPDDVAFTATTDGPVDRWTLAVLDRFDGADWTSTARFRPLGADLPPEQGVTAPLQTFHADVTPGPGLTGPWLPAPDRTASVDRLRPAVDPDTGVLLLPATERTGPYGVTWRSPRVAGDGLVGAAVDPNAATLAVDDVPAGVADAAQRALAGAPPSFAAALRLEKWFRDTFTVASGKDLPTGSGAAQLLYFLDDSKRGTSEQFATAYALIARTVGLPVRLAVGFRQPTERDAGGRWVVRNRDALAWPEVAVAGVGWVALDPTGDAKREPDAPGSVSQAARKARDQLPQSGAIAGAQPAAGPGGTESTSQPPPPNGSVLPMLLAGALVVSVLALLAAAGIPITKQLRRLRRRRGRPGDAVDGAWREARDRLRDHGVPVRSSMTVRDLREPAATVLNGSSAELDRLARCVDVASWSGRAVEQPVADDAWAASSAISRALAARPLGERLRAAWRIRTLTGRGERQVVSK